MNKIIIIVFLFFIVTLPLSTVKAQTGSEHLVTHWDFDEGTGFVAQDNIGTLDANMDDGNIQWITGVQGSGWDLPGTDHGDYGSGVNLHGLTRDFTISFWLNGTDEDFFSGAVLDLGSRGSAVDEENHGLQASFTVGGEFRVTIQTGLASGFNGESRGRWNTEMTVGDGWNQFVITSTSTEANAYHYGCDGTLNTNTITGDFGESLDWEDRRHRIGGIDASLSDDAPSESVGRFDEIRIYDAELTASEIQAQFDEDFHTNLCTVGEEPPEPTPTETGVTPPGHNSPGDTFFGVPLQPVADGFGEDVRTISWFTGVFLIILLMATMGVAWGIVGIVIGALVGLIASFALGLFPIWFLVILIFGIVILGLLVFRNFGGGEE